MKSSICGGVLVLAVALAPQMARAQGTMTYLSNLDQASAGSLAVGSNSWVAALFVTGTNLSGYLLNSVQLGMTDASGSPSGFTALLYSATASFGPPLLPGHELGTFSGSLNPATGGIYTFTTISNLLLAPDTDYYIVLAAGTAVADGAYEWSYTGADSYKPSGGWSSGGGVIWTSSNGAAPPPRPATWSLSSDDDAQFAIDATPIIPEPGVLGLLGLGGLGFLLHRRKNSPRENRG